VLAPDVRRTIDRVWDGVWSSGVSNPLTCIEYVTPLLLACWLHHDGDGAPLEGLRAALADGDAAGLRQAVADLDERCDLPGDGKDVCSLYTSDLAAARRALDSLAALRLDDRNRDLFGDVYEHMAGRLSTAGRFGQFRTPRHVVRFVVEVVAPRPADVVLDPACGTGGFLIAAHEYVRAHDGASLGRFVGEEIDGALARVARSNVALHGLGHGEIRRCDSLQNRSGTADVILANPPFAGAVTPERVPGYAVGSARSELLFVELMLERLRRGGRAGIVVPFGVLTSPSRPARYLRERLLRANTLDAVVELPSGVFRPYTGVRTALLFWRGGGSTRDVLLARVDADGYSLDDRRAATTRNDLPAVLDAVRSRAAGAACATVVAATDIAGDANLSPSRYLPAAPPQGRGPGVEAAARRLAERTRVLAATVAEIEEFVHR
jgi:type I restriction enzyme M protein